MALINCSECAKQVSSSAANCPHCGVAIASKAETAAAGAPLVTTQHTSKKLKMHTLISVCAVLVGIFWMMGSDKPTMTPVFLIAIGLVWMVVTRFRIWWHHE